MEFKEIKLLGKTRRSSVIDQVTRKIFHYDSLYQYGDYVTVGKKSGKVIPPQNLTKMIFRKLNPDRNYELMKGVLKDEKPLIKHEENTPIAVSLPICQSIGYKEKLIEKSLEIADECLKLSNKIIDFIGEFVGKEEK